MRSAILLLCLLWSLTGDGQAQAKFQKPDLPLIASQVKDPQSLHYYPYLYSRYLGGDTSLSVEDYIYLYYGSGFRESSDMDTGVMTAKLSLRDSISAVYQGKDSLTEADYLRLIPFYQAELKADPFSIRYITKLATAYRITGQTDLYRPYKYRLNTLLDAILSTGDGRSVETAWYVTQIAHEYDVIWALGLTFGGEQRLVGNMTCDYLTLAPNEYKLSGVYFNTEISMARLTEMLGGSKREQPAGKRKGRKKN